MAGSFRNGGVSCNGKCGPARISSAVSCHSIAAKSDLARRPMPRFLSFFTMVIVLLAQGLQQTTAGNVLDDPDFDAAAALLKALPKSSSLGGLLAAASPEGHWVFVNADGEQATAADKAEVDKLLPVLVPDLSYETLEIQEGGTASLIYSQLKFQDAETAAQKRKHLLAYCEMDTLAMVELHSHLDAIVNY